MHAYVFAVKVLFEENADPALAEAMAAHPRLQPHSAREALKWLERRS